MDNNAKIELVEIKDIIPYENNPRFNDGAVEAVANSIKEFGFKQPLVLDKNKVIIAGHTRLKASKELGLKRVPCIIADDLNAEQVQAYRLADNKTGEIATWNWEELTAELEELANFDFDMSEFGFMENNRNELGIENDEIYDMNFNGIEGITHGDKILRFSNKKIFMTDEEEQMLLDAYSNYIDSYGVAYGFVRWLLKDD